MSEKPAMVIIEDHPVMRKGLTCYFNETGRWRVIGSASSLDESKEILTRNEADIILLDIQLEDGWGIDIYSWLKQRKAAPLPVMAVYSAFNDYAYVSAALNSGVSVYVCKHQNEEALENALVKALNGETYIDNGARLKLKKIEDLCSLLTKREAEILTMVKNGLSNHEIARNIGISNRTVENILCCVYDKTGVKSRVELLKL